MPQLTADQLTLALAVVAGVGLLSLLTTLLLALRIRKLRRAYALLRGEADERDIIATVSRFARRMEALDERVDTLAVDLDHHRDRARGALQRFHLVRYDAFEEMGGRLSFSAALLDDNGDGIVITSINGRTETRTYAKPIVGLKSEHNLSEEERAAISGAMSGRQRQMAKPTAV